MELGFNKIYVIESLPSDDLKTGTNLYNDIIKRKLWQLEGYDSELVEVSSKSELFKLFEEIKEAISSAEIIPFLHFEIHGNPKGFVLESKEQITWLELHNRFIEMNIATNLKIWVSLATCYGAYIHTIIKPTDRAPFYGYVGAWQELDANDLSVSYERFFSELLDSFNMTEAVAQLNLENPNLPVEYQVHSVKDVFKRAYAEYEKNMYEPVMFNKRVESIVKQGLSDPRNSKLNLTADFFRENAIKMLIDDKNFYRDKYWSNFLLMDLYPENNQRFGNIGW